MRFQPVVLVGPDREQSEVADAKRGQVRIAFRLNQEPRAGWFDILTDRLDSFADTDFSTSKSVQLQGRTVSAVGYLNEVDGIVSNFNTAADAANAVYQAEHADAIALQDQLHVKLEELDSRFREQRGQGGDKPWAA